MAGEFISTTGTWMQVMADSWVLTSLTHSAFVMGLSNFASGLPVLLLTAVGGSTADRFSKRNILMATQIAQILLAATMGVLVMTHLVQIWMVMVIAALLGVVNAFEMPAASSLVPELVDDKEEIQDAMAVDRSSFHTTRLVGPSLAGFVIGLWGAAIAYFANAFSFVALMLALRSLPEREPDEGEEEGSSRSFMEGVTYVKRDPLTLAMIALLGLLTLVPIPVLMILLPLYARTQLNLGATGMGTLMSINAAGSLVGSFWLLTVSREQRLSRLAMLAVGIAAGLMGLAAFHQMWAAAGFLFVMSFCMASTFGLANTTIQERAPNQLRGRISALSSMTFFGLQPFAGLALSSFSDLVGMDRAFTIAAPLFAVGAFFVLGVLAKRQPPEGPVAQAPQEASTPVMAAAGEESL